MHIADGINIVKNGTADIKAIIFLQDPFTVHPATSDIAALTRICNMHNIPLVTNVAFAEAVLHFFFEKIPGHHIERKLSELTADNLKTCTKELCIP